MPIIGNVIGGGSGAPKSIVLQTEDGEEMYAVLVDSEVIFTAGANDIRKGKIAATANGVVIGTAVIPDCTKIYALINSTDGMCLGLFAGSVSVDNPKFIEIPVYDMEYVSKYYISGSWYEDAAGNVRWTSSLI